MELCDSVTEDENVQNAPQAMIDAVKMSVQFTKTLSFKVGRIDKKRSRSAVPSCLLLVSNYAMFIQVISVPDHLFEYQHTFQDICTAELSRV